MTSLPSELTGPALISLMEQGAYERDVLVTIARGFLPLPQEDLVAVLAYLSGSEEEEASSAARASIADLPQRIVLTYASDENGNPDHLSRLLRATSDGTVVEALVRNRAVPDESIIDIARTAETAVQDVIIINQARILRTPQILDALLENPAISGDVRRRIAETREEFFDKKARLLAEALPPDLPLEPDLRDADIDPIADLLLKALDPEVSRKALPTPPPDDGKDDPEKQALWVRLSFMTIAQRVQLAFRGDKMVRMLLVRERNKIVCSAVMRNPRMSDNEAEMIAGMRNVEEEVLRILSTRRDWMAKYAIMLQLVRNPKAPVGVVLPMINRLALRDLKFLRDDRGVAEVVRFTAKRIYLSRTQKS
jgi:hypothetical protein